MYLFFENHIRLLFTWELQYLRPTDDRMCYISSSTSIIHSKLQMPPAFICTTTPKRIKGN